MLQKTSRRDTNFAMQSVNAQSFGYHFSEDIKVQNVKTTNTHTQNKNKKIKRVQNVENE